MWQRHSRFLSETKNILCGETLEILEIMDQKLTQEKLKMWNDKLVKLQEEYEVIMQKRGEAIAMGDLSENAAFQMLDEDAVTWRVRIEEIEKIIKGLESNN